MTIPYHITVSHVSEKKLIKEIIDKTFDEVNTIYNHYNPNSEISRFNQFPEGVVFSPSQELLSLLEKVGQIHTLSCGRFDPTVLPLQDLWKSHLEKGSIPSIKDQSAIAVGWNHLQVSEKGLIKNRPCEIDLGGIAKGFLVDLITKRLYEIGYQDILVEWGGEMRASGQHPEGRPWKIYITQGSDTDPKHALAFVELCDQAIATSGDYLQQWAVDGKTYTHIINPKTKLPITNFSSVTVMASSCTFADALATTAMLFDTLEEAQMWATKIQNEYPDVTFWFVSSEMTPQ